MFIYKNNFYWLAVIFIIFIISFYFFFIGERIYYFSDVYAYLSYAENLYNYGYIYDITTIPSTAPKTTQNGITLVFTFLRFFTEDMVIRVKIVIVLLTINLFFIFFILYKIGEILRLDMITLKLFVVFLVISLSFYGYYITPINDGFYASLFLFSIYIILRIIDEDKNDSKKYWIFLFLLTITIPIFRLQGMIELIASIIVFTLIQKNYKKALISFLFIPFSFVSVWIINYFLINDISGITEISKNSIFYSYGSINNSLNKFLFEVVPEMFLSPQLDLFKYYLSPEIKLFFSISLLVFTGYVFFKSYIDRNPKMFFLILIVIGNYCVLFIFNVIIERYIFINMPLMLLIILYYMKNYYNRYLIFVILIYSFFNFVEILKIHNLMFKNKLVPSIEFIKENYKDYNLISSNPRGFYFYFNKPSIEDINLIDKNIMTIMIGDDNLKEKIITKFTNDKLTFNIQELPLSWGQFGYKTYEITFINEKSQNEN